jgi:hypothetical protein
LDVVVPPELSRGPLSELGPCDLCSQEAFNPRTLFLQIDFEDSSLVACPVCESMLLHVLLANYVKRLRRNKVGFLLTKPVETEELNGT